MSQALESGWSVSFQWRLRSFNKHILNRLTIRLARTSFGSFVIVRHVGRRSGKTYETPIIAIKRPNSFVVALTYGSQVDWYRNVAAANGCVLIWHSQEYVVDHLEPLDTNAALPFVPAPFRPILRLLHTDYFVEMRFQPPN